MLTQCEEAFALMPSIAYQRTCIPGNSFECSDCGKGFINQLQLLAHSRAHSKENFYELEQSKKAFTQSTNYSALEKCYEDKECRKAFTVHSGLTPYVQSLMSV